MKRCIPIIVAVLFVCICSGQVPQNIAISRWTFPGIPNVTGLVLTANHKAPKQAWFTEQDSSKIGSFVFPRTCISAAATEYDVFPILPYKITYAENAFTVTGSGTMRPPKYKPQAWFIAYSAIYNVTAGLISGRNTASPMPGLQGDWKIENEISGRDTVYAVVPPAKNSSTGTLVAFPTGGGSIGSAFPLGIQWAPKVKKVPAAIWFNGLHVSSGNPALIGLYSLSPVTKGTAPFEATLTQYGVDNSSINAAGFRIENGFVWLVYYDTGNSKLYLCEKPVDNAQGLRWDITAMVPTPDRVALQPMYTRTKAKYGVLPNQVAVNFLTGCLFLTISPSNLLSAVDSICVNSGQSSVIPLGYFCDNAAKADTGKKLIETDLQLGIQPGDDESILRFRRLQPTSVISREAVSFTASTVTIHGIGRLIATNSKSLQASCIMTTATWASPACVAYEWNAVLPGLLVGMSTSPSPRNHIARISDISAPGSVEGTAAPLIDIAGTSDPKKFDLVLHEPGGAARQGFDMLSALIRIKGKFGARPGQAPETEPEYSSAVESEEPPDFELDEAYPNPFNPVTTIRFTLPGPSRVTLTVYNMLGQIVARPIDGVDMDSGEHETTFDGSNSASGAYFYRLQAGAFSATKKLILVK